MTNPRTIFQLLMFSGIILLSACNAEEPEPTTPTAPPTSNPNPFVNSFTATVDGNEFVETLLVGTESPGANSILITASQSTFPSIGIAFSNTITPGTYTYQGSFGSRRGIYNISNNADGQYSANSGTGSLEIISHNLTTNEIVGNFSFIASPNMGNTNTNSYNITSGSFSIKYN